jgi:hypothetical protein
MARRRDYPRLTVMTYVSGFEHLNGDQWQDLCIRVLRQHHGGTNLIPVPDDDGGDAGLEAFSLDGCVYQCYAPERGDMLTTRALYGKHRNKMTADVGKFIDNVEKITKLVPPGLKISRWVLLVPVIRGRKIIEHSKEKTAEVRAAGLPYAAGEIVVCAHTLDTYELAMKAVINAQVIKLNLPPLTPPDYGHIDDSLIGKMINKLSMTGRFADEDLRAEFVGRLLVSHVGGQAHRAHIGDHFSDLGEELETRLNDLEQRLSVHYALEHPVPDRRLLTVLKDTEAVVDETLNTRHADSRVIAEGQVAEWLMRCPLDFR